MMNISVSEKVIGGWNTKVIHSGHEVIMVYAGEGGAIMSGNLDDYANVEKKYIESMEAYRLYNIMLAKMTDQEKHEFSVSMIPIK